MTTERDVTSPLTERQTEVLQLASRSLTGPAIGRQLWLSPDAAKGHLKHACAVLGVHTQAAAVATAWRAGWIR